MARGQIRTQLLVRALEKRLEAAESQLAELTFAARRGQGDGTEAPAMHS
jgi:hypothetical protein